MYQILMLVDKKLFVGLVDSVNIVVVGLVVSCLEFSTIAWVK